MNKIKKFLLIINLVLLPIVNLLAIEQICTPDKDCFNVEQGIDEIYLIGCVHEKEWPAFEIKLINNACQKNIVHLQESLSDDKATRTNIAKSIGYKDPGYLLGMENSLVNIFMDLVYEYAVIYLVTTQPDLYADVWFERAQDRKLNVLTMLLTDEKARNLWKEFAKSKEVKKLNKNIIAVINNLIKSKSQFAQSEAYRKLSKDDYQWLDLFKHFAVYILDNHIAKLPVELQPDIEKIRDFLLNKPEESEYLVYIRFDLNSYWRNIFIKENIKKAIEFAKEVKKPLFILIGQDHYKDIESFLKSTNYKFNGYPQEELQGDEELVRAVLEQTRKEL